jgi:hypothetical protein
VQQNYSVRVAGFDLIAVRSQYSLLSDLR